MAGSGRALNNNGPSESLETPAPRLVHEERVRISHDDERPILIFPPY